MNEQIDPRANPDPYKPPQEISIEPEPQTQFRSARHAFLIGCRNGLIWSVVLGGPMTWFIVPILPRQRSFDAEGNLIPLIEQVGWAEVLRQSLPAFIGIAAIWTVSAGIAALNKHVRQH